MRIERLGGRQFAFDLDWSNGKGPYKRAGTTHLRNELRAKYDTHVARYFYYAVCGDKLNHAIGGGFLARKPHGKVCSYAATLAALGHDGIYIARVDPHHLWFCVVRGGVVISPTDRIGDDRDILSSVEADRVGMQFSAESIYAGPEVSIPSGSTPFDPVAIVTHVRRPARLLQHLPAKPYILWGGIAVCVVAAAIGLHFVMAPSARALATRKADQQRAQAVAQYRSKVTRALSGYPADPGWPAAAWQYVSHHTPGYLGGFSLKSVECTVHGCTLTYGSGSNSTAPFAVTPFYAAFGRSAVRYASTHHTVTVHVWSGSPVFRVTSAFLHHPPLNVVGRVNWFGAAPLHIYGTVRTDPLKHANVAATFGGARVGFPALFIDETGFGGSSSFPLALAGAMHWGRRGRYRVTGFALKRTGDADMRWSIALLAVYGQDTR
ncbi:MAG TPA: hypothetical protein VFQ88_09595 [Nevskiaceae bacterium]|nr:hypothetical protein [Nevskiaceae bacterium]